jgi:hypothetical protein
VDSVGSGIIGTAGSGIGTSGMAKRVRRGRLLFLFGLVGGVGRWSLDGGYAGNR